MFQGPGIKPFPDTIFFCCCGDFEGGQEETRRYGGFGLPFDFDSGIEGCHLLCTNLAAKAVVQINLCIPLAHPASET